MKKLSLFCFTSLLLLFSSCASGPKREEGSCVLSAQHGGPYVVVQENRKGLLLRDPLKKTEELGPLKNDESWEEISCPF